MKPPSTIANEHKSATTLNREWFLGTLGVGCGLMLTTSFSGEGSCSFSMDGLNASQDGAITGSRGFKRDSDSSPCWCLTGGLRIGFNVANRFRFTNCFGFEDVVVQRWSELEWLACSLRSITMNSLFTNLSNKLPAPASSFY